MSSPMRPVYGRCLVVEKFLLISIVFPVWTILYGLPYCMVYRYVLPCRHKDFMIKSNVLHVNSASINSVEFILVATLARTWSRECCCLWISTRCEGITCSWRCGGASCLSSGWLTWGSRWTGWSCWPGSRSVWIAGCWGISWCCVRVSCCCWNSSTIINLIDLKYIVFGEWNTFGKGKFRSIWFSDDIACYTWLSARADAVVHDWTKVVGRALINPSVFAQLPWFAVHRASFLSYLNMVISDNLSRSARCCSWYHPSACMTSCNTNDVWRISSLLA